jgi:hypothetical protein
MRKLLLSLACVLFAAGLVAAAEVTLVKYDKDKKELTVKDDKDKEKTYKVTDKTKVYFGQKAGEFAAIEKILTDATAPGKFRMDIATDKDEVTEIRTRPRKK